MKALGQKVDDSKIKIYVSPKQREESRLTTSSSEWPTGRNGEDAAAGERVLKKHKPLAGWFDRPH